jgi:hypothetical protein
MIDETRFCSSLSLSPPNQHFLGYVRPRPSAEILVLARDATLRPCHLRLSPRHLLRECGRTGCCAAITGAWFRVA